MLNKKESLLRRDQAVSWLWACRKAGFHRDVARLIASHVFDGFKYVNGTVHQHKNYRLKIENGKICRNGDLLGTVDHKNERCIPALFCYVTALCMKRRNFMLDGLDGHLATVDETGAIMEILMDIECGVEVKVNKRGVYQDCRTFGDILSFENPGLEWHCFIRRTDDDFEDNKPYGLLIW